MGQSIFHRLFGAATSAWKPWRVDRVVISFCCIALLAGCESAGKKPLVFGLYDVPEENLLEVRQAGFDVVTPRPSQASQEYLDAANKAKIGVLLPSAAFSANRSIARHRLTSFDRHPATWGWYLVDEPDLHEIPPPRVSEVTRAFQQRALKKGVIVLSSGNVAVNYGEDCDLLMVDFYPVPWAPLARFAKEMRLADFARGDKPYMAVVQAFDWTHFAEVLGQTNGLRPPTIAEVRCMAYMALALEARGLFFYSYEARTWRLADSELWPRLQGLVQELRRNAALFAGPPIWWPAEVEYADPARMYNEAQDGVILSRLYHVKNGAETRAPGYYFLVINTTGEEVGYDFRIPFSDIESVRVTDHDSERRAGAGDSLPLEDGWLRRTYAPYEVLLIGPINPALSLESVRNGVFQ